MLSFKKIEITDKEKIEQYTKQKNYFMCEHCFADLFIWRNHYNTQFCIQDGFLFIKMQSVPDNTHMYLAPIGSGDLKAAIELIENDAKEKNIDFIMISVPEELKETIEEFFPDKFTFNEERDNADYIYLAEDLISLKGKKLHAKRNYINRFKNTYDGLWEYENLTCENAREMFNYQLKWCELNECNEQDSFLGETCAIAQALNNFKELELRGGLLRLNNEIIAFTLGSKSHDDMFVVHIEKADYTIPGAYQMINQQFVQQNCNDVMYVDREEDLGIEGLRKAKLSYYPHKLGVNFSAVYK